MQIYLCCVAEFNSGILGLEPPGLFAGFDWAIDRLRECARCDLRYGEDLQTLSEKASKVRLAWTTDEEDPSYSELTAWSLIKDSAPALFPHIVRLTEDGECVGGQVRFNRIWSQQAPALLLVPRLSQEPSVGRYYYLPPWLNRYQQDEVQLDPHEEIRVVDIVNYGEPREGKTFLIVEGDSDEVFWERLLKKLYPAWKALSISFIQSRGYGGLLGAVDHVIRAGSEFVLVYDSDAQKQLDRSRNQRQWKMVFETIDRSPRTRLEPDLEGVNVDAVVKAVRCRHPEVGFDEAHVRQEIDQYKRRVAAGGDWKNGTLGIVAEHINRCCRSGEGHISHEKDRAWGELLAAAMLEGELAGPIIKILTSVLSMARGLAGVATIKTPGPLADSPRDR